MLRRLIVMTVIVALVVLVVSGLPDIRRFFKIREM